MLMVDVSVESCANTSYSSASGYPSTASASASHQPAMRQRPPSTYMSGASGRINGNNNGVGIGNNNSRGGKKNNSNSNNKQNHNSKCHFVSKTITIIPFIVLLAMVMLTIQLVLNYALYGGQGYGASINGNMQSHHEYVKVVGNSYDVLLKNTINYGIASSNASNSNNNSSIDDRNNAASMSMLQEQINNLRSEITTLESKSKKYVDDPRFFPFVIRDSRHLTPTQINPDFHIFDYVDLTQAKQPKSAHSQLLHNARLVIDDELEERRKNMTKKKVKKNTSVEKYEAPCQRYSVQCYRQKILQVFSYILRNFPNVEYYFYIEADNDLCVPMTMVKDLALAEQRYFINTGIGFSGWIMSREFLHDFIQLYGNATLDEPVTKVKPGSTTNENIVVEPEIRPDVLASYYLTDRQAWSVTRQYWVSHTTLESLGVASLTVKDRRKDETGERMKLDKHLPRCLEPRRGKWKVSRKKPYLDPRDRFGWDYFDYDVCPNELLFPCGGQDQLKKLIADDWRVANETGALAKWATLEVKRKKAEAAKEEKNALAVAMKAAKLKEQVEKDAREGRERRARPMQKEK